MKVERDSRPKTGIIPAAAELLPDIFVAVSERFFSQKSIVLAAAEAHGFQRGTLDTANPPGTNCTFRLKADAAVSYLYRSGFISRLGRKGRVSITQEGYDFLRNVTLEVIGSLSAEIEPKIKRLKGRAVPAPKNSVQEPQADSMPTLRTAKALQERIEQAKRLADGMPTPEERAGMRATKIGARLPDMPLDKLHAIWINAQEKLSHPKLEFRLAAKALLAAIDEEREKRGPNASSLLPGGGFFRWPSTAAEKGDGQLSFEADAFGILAGAGYRVGITRGEPEPARRRTLARLFKEQVLDSPAAD
ncbi:MAG: hypothetical protein E5W55_07170, partial [Mesorhizobium sp.]